jgi:hypothetical protein
MMSPALSPSEILRAWEWGSARHPVDRALVVLWAAEPERDPGALAEVPIGERDRRLLALRRATFGDRLACLAPCPACASPLEFELSTSTLLQGAGVPGSPRSPSPDQDTIANDGYVVRLRALDSRDLAAAARCADLASAEAVLLARAVTAAEHDGAPIAAEALPPALRDAVAEHLAARNGAADIGLDLACPTCGHRWEATFDIAAFLWTEIESAARRLLLEVAALARSYGWREADILAMSPARRRAYLELGGAG